MSFAYTFRNVTEALPVLCKDILRGGDELGSRNGRVKELTNVQITLTHPWEREVLSAHRHASVAAQIAETMWVLAGRNDVEWLSHYLPRAADFSDDGKTWRAGYGPRIRAWRGFDPVGGYSDTDQVQQVIDVLREDPTSRRAVINIFDPAQDFRESKDIPCNNWLHFLSRDGRLNLHVAVRSNDLMWGWSNINTFEWSVLQEIVASCLGIQVGTLTFSISSLHLYEHHWAKAEKIGAEGGVGAYRGQPLDLRNLHMRWVGNKKAASLQQWDGLIEQFFTAEKSIRLGDQPAVQDMHIRAIKHPSIRSMLYALQFYWGGDIGDSLFGMALAQAVDQSPNGGRKKAKPHPVNTDFIESAIKIHNEKHKAYGDSWKKRGEAVSIQANIARKVDRLGGGDTSDETQADTALDLLVYLAKYSVWLGEQASQGLREDGLQPSDSTEHPNAVLRKWDREWAVQAEKMAGGMGDARTAKVHLAETRIKSDFERLLGLSNWELKRDLVVDLAFHAYALAAYWHEKAGDDYRGADHD